jgi:hypothetical protein
MCLILKGLGDLTLHLKGCILLFMPSKSRSTVAVTVRILRTQEDALNRENHGFTSRSELVRLLLQLYLDGQIPIFKPSPQQKNAA